MSIFKKFLKRLFCRHKLGELVCNIKGYRCSEWRCLECGKVFIKDGYGRPYPWE